LPDLPEHYKQKLTKAVKAIVNPKRKKKERLSLNEVEKIRLAFF
jgi:hypothetical protein